MVRYTTHYRSVHKPLANINMVPFIDVMLVLLVVFMVSAPLLIQGVNVNLPKVANEPLSVSDEQPPVIVSINANGAYFMEVGGQRERAETLTAVQKKIKKVVAARPGIQVLIRGDQQVAYGTVVALMTRLQQAGIAQVGLVTDPVPLPAL